MEAVDLGAVEPVAERTFTHELVVPELPVSSPQDDPDIVNTYSLVVKLVSHTKDNSTVAVLMIRSIVQSGA